MDISNYILYTRIQVNTSNLFSANISSPISLSQSGCHIHFLKSILVEKSNKIKVNSDIYLLFLFLFFLKSLLRILIKRVG